MECGKYMYQNSPISSLSNEALLKAYHDAISFNLDHDFLELLVGEIGVRKLLINDINYAGVHFRNTQNNKYRVS